MIVPKKVWNLSGPVISSSPLRSRSPNPKKVTFNLKTTVHEYEKLKYISEESSDGEDSINNDYKIQPLEESKGPITKKRDIELMSLVKKPFTSFNISPDDPVFKYEYN